VRAPDEYRRARTERLRLPRTPKHRPGYTRPDPRQARVVQLRPRMLRPVGR